MYGTIYSSGKYSSHGNQFTYVITHVGQQGTIPTINTTAVPPAATTPPSSNTGQTTEGTLVPPTQDTLVPPTQDTLVPPTLANVQSVGEIVAIAVCVALSVLLAVSCGAVLTAVVVHRCRKRRRRRNVLPTDCVPKCECMLYSHNNNYAFLTVRIFVTIWMPY